MIINHPMSLWRVVLLGSLNKMSYIVIVNYNAMHHLSMKQQDAVTHQIFFKRFIIHFLALKPLLSFTFLGILLFSVGCKTETLNTDSANSSANVVTTTLIGKVVDEAGSPVAGVTIICGTQTAVPNEFGIFVMKDVTVPSDRYYVKAVKSGYFTASRAAKPTGNGISRVSLVMMPTAGVYSYQTAIGGTITLSNMMTINMPAGSLVNQASGAYYQGKVNVAARYFNPTSSDFAVLTPGNLDAITATKEHVVLKSYGAINLELYTESGEKLQLAQGNSAVLRYTIPDKLAGDAPFNIPLWYFDEEKGYWIEEGKAIKEGKQYVGSVSHFTAWNADVDAPPAYIKGRVVACDGLPVPGIKVRVDNQLEITDEKGFYYHAVRAKSSGIVELREADNLGLFYAQTQTFQSGASGDTTRVANSSVACPARVIGNIIDCDSLPVNGLVYVVWSDGSNFTYSIKSAFSIPVPSNKALSLTVVVDDKFKKINIPALTNLEQKLLPLVKVCDLIDTVGIENSFYVNGDIFNDELIILKESSNNYARYDSLTDSTYVYYATVNKLNDSCKLSFKFKGAAIGASKLLKAADFDLVLRGKRYEGGKVTTSIDAIGELGADVLGTYGGSIRNKVTGVADVTISKGRFKLTRK